MSVRIQVLAEPLIEYSDGVVGIDPRADLTHDGLDKEGTGDPAVIPLGLVCLEEERERIEAFVQRLSGFLHSFEPNPQRFRDFPGSANAFCCRFDIQPRFVRTIPSAEYERAASLSPGSRFDEMLNLFASRVESMFLDVHPGVILVGLPDAEGDLAIINPRLTASESEALRARNEEDKTQLDLFAPNEEDQKRLAELNVRADELLYRQFYRALKARCMTAHNAVPLQVLREHTYDEELATQSLATRAWHLSVAMYYKSGHTPWRPYGLPHNSCFVGISFHYLKRRFGDIIYASLAQAFSNEIEPFILKGDAISPDQIENRQPHMTEEQACNLAIRIIATYKSLGGVTPTRVVLHKTSRYSTQEVAGFRAGCKDVPFVDLVWIVPTGFRLLKAGTEGVWRGTLCTVGEKDHYLFTTGYVPGWREYPGPHIPAPLQIGTAGDSDTVARAREILELTKMNWNSSDAISRAPITLSFARRVGQIMTELDEDQDPNPSYRFYM